MTSNDLLAEAEYADIVITLLKKPYLVSSITKIIFMAFCTRHENHLAKYNHRTKDFVDVFISNVSLKLSAHYYELGKILKIIDMLNRTGKVAIEGDSIALAYDFNFVTGNPFLKSCSTRVPNPIIEINKLDPKAMIEEVLRYV